jgi:hypothetical protein
MRVSSAFVSVESADRTHRVDLKIRGGLEDGFLKLTVVDLDTGRSDAATLGDSMLVSLEEWATECSSDQLEGRIASRLTTSRIDQRAIRRVFEVGTCLFQLVN